MGRKSTISNLPNDIRDQLIDRLIASGFTGYEAHEEWAAEMGHPCSKSAIHRFGTSIEEVASNLDLRVRIAEAASRYSTAETVADNASELLRWIIGSKV